MQAVAQISPTLGIFYTIAFTTGQAGMTAPLTYLLAFILCLTLAVPLGGLARRMPSAGGYYTYVSEGLGPKTGYMVGWLYGASVALVPAALAAFTGAVLHDELDAEYQLRAAVVGLRGRDPGAVLVRRLSAASCCRPGSC